jgi:hypothetical protein
MVAGDVLRGGGRRAQELRTHTAEAAVTRLRGLVVLSIVGGIACAARPAEAQVPVQQQLAAARQHIVNLKTDSAAQLLQSVLDMTSGASGSERSWAYALLAVVRLAEQNRNGARLMFEQSLRSDPRLSVDSLAILRDLDSEAEVVFQEARVVVQGAARGAAAPAAPFSIEYQVARDTTLSGPEDQLAITLLPARRARTVVTVRTAGESSVLWRSDTLPAGESRPILWLPRSNGRPLPNNVYGFEVTGVDSVGTLATPVRWTMRLIALPPVAQPAPRELSASDQRPETLQVRHRSAATLLAGAGLGVVAAVLPTAFGRTEVNAGLAGDATAYVVAGSVAVAGIIGYLNGRRAVYQPENARLNAERRARYEADVRAGRAANEQARQRPPIRLQIERSAGP